MHTWHRAAAASALALSLIAPVRAQCVPAFDATPGLPGFNSDVFALATFDSGNGPELYAGGRFATSGATPVRGLARWTGSAWEEVAGGVAASPGLFAVRTLLAHDDGSGEALFLAGYFTAAGGTQAASIARFDGTQFHPVGGGLPSMSVNALAICDLGSGPQLFAGTDFSAAQPGGVWRFDGSAWSIVGGGLTMAPLSGPGSVMALAAFDSGSGVELYAGGNFHSGSGQATHYIARFDGTSWRDVGGGVNEPVHAMEVFDSGGGAELYCGGTFLAAGSPPVPAAHAARWDGQDWRDLGNADPFAFFGIIGALEVFDDGTGPALYLAGQNGFGPTPLFRWTGGPAWSPMGTTLTGRVLALGSVGGCGSDLFLGGSFSKLGNASVARAARYRGCPTSAAELQALTPAKLGQDLVLAGTSAGNAGLGYFCGFSLSATPGIALPHGTLIPLGIDGLLLASLDPASPLFDDAVGSLDATCGASVRFHVPLVPAAAGLPFVAALIVFDPLAPDGVRAVSPPLALVLEL